MMKEGMIKMVVIMMHVHHMVLPHMTLRWR